MNQLELPYRPEHLAEAVWRDELAWVRRAVDLLGLKEVAFECDTSPSSLCDALAGRDRHVRAEWVRTIVLMSPDGMRREWLQIVSRPLGFEPERIKVIDAAEELRITRELLQRVAPVVLAVVDKELGR